MVKEMMENQNYLINDSLIRFIHPFSKLWLFTYFQKESTPRNTIFTFITIHLIYFTTLLIQK